MANVVSYVSHISGRDPGAAFLLVPRWSGLEVYPVSSNMAAMENQPFISADIFKII